MPKLVELTRELTQCIRNLREIGRSLFTGLAGQTSQNFEKSSVLESTTLELGRTWER